MMNKSIFLSLIGLMLVAMVDVGWAASEESISSDQRSYEQNLNAVVRNKHFYKEGRIEVGGVVGILPYDSLISHYMIGGRLNWHFADHYGWEVIDLQVAFPSVTKYTTDLVSAKGIGDLQTPELKLLVASNFLISPFYGKIRVAGSTVLHFDLYITVGLGMAKTNTLKIYAASEGGAVSTDTIRSTWDPMFNFGLGLKIFLNDAMGLVVDFRDYVIHTQLWDGKRLQSNFSITAGLTFFIPTFG